MKLTGYSVGELAWEDHRSVVYAATQDGTGRQVLLRRPRAAGHDPRELDRIRRDFEITSELPSDLVVPAVALESYEGGFVLVLQDEGARPLQRVLAARSLEVTEALRIGASLASAVGQLHSRQFIHRNLNPHSVWYQEGLGIRLSNFELASRVSQDGHQIPVAGRIDGLRTHIAPEQTGRLHRAVDRRADHYSIGVLLYQLLTGQLPFDSLDDLEIEFALVARVPTSPIELDGRIPGPVSEVVMKLLKKAPDERYQSAHGLRVDLRECLDQLDTAGTVESFELGRHDSFETFQISEKLYGREDSAARLRQALDEARRGPARVVAVTGGPGTGKSVLVRELQQSVVEVNGSYVSGKFDQYRQDLPFSGIVVALQELMGQILRSPDDELRAWKERLLEAVGQRGQVLVDVIPELELITGPCPPVPKLPVEEDRNRFNLVFRDFARALATAEQPLVLFLDDLQWVDAGSLGLLHVLATDRQVRHLLIVLAFRDGEVHDGHPLSAALEGLKRQGVLPASIHLDPLAVEHVTELILDTVRAGQRASVALAELIDRKTGGNPFFVNQFLRFLYEEDLIFFDRELERWSWDLVRIEAEGITDDVVDLMTTRISRISPEAQRTLTRAAFLGAEFSLRRAAAICERDPPSVLEDLQEARQAGLLVGLGARGKSSTSPGSAGEEPVFRFLHDRVQQAAYVLVPTGDRDRAHLRVGRILRSTMSREDLATAPFDVVNNLNRGIHLVTDLEERAELAKLNLLAASKAQETSAYDAARSYLNTGIELLSDDCWGQDYPLSYELYRRRLQMDFVTGALGKAEEAFLVLQEHVSDPLQRAAVANQMITIHAANERAEAAFEVAAAALADLGAKLPTRFRRLRLVGEILWNRFLVRRRRPTELLSLPMMDDRRREATVMLLSATMVPAYVLDQWLMSWTAARIVNMTIRHGVAEASGYGFAAHAIVVGSGLGDYQAGFEYGEVSVSLAKRFNNIGFQSNALFSYAAMAHIWRRSLQSSLEELDKARELALEAGDVQFVVYAVLHKLFMHIAKGSPLGEIEAIADRHQAFVEDTRNDFAKQVAIAKRWVAALTDDVVRVDLDGDGFDEKAVIEKIDASGNRTNLYYVYFYKLQLAYLAGDHERAFEMGEKAQAAILGVLGQILTSEHYFYVGLSAAALARAQKKRRRFHLRRLRQCIRKFRRWASNCPENFEDKHLLLLAELTSLKDPGAALGRYDAAIAVAEHYGFRQNTAIANELAARHARAAGHVTVAEVYLKHALDAFAAWGATGKVRQLGSEFEGTELAVPPPPPERPQPLHRQTDLLALLRVLKQIAVEKDMGRLLKRLHGFLLEHAGAQRGCVVISSDGALVIEASGSADEDPVVLTSILAKDSAELCYPIVRYVSQTNVDVVLDDARSDPRYAKDPYVRERQPRSILCSPVLHQGELVGVVYLENNLTAGAFTPERLEVLQLIASDIAIAIHNARLHEDLRKSAQVRKWMGLFVNEKVRKVIEENPEAPELGKQDADVSVLFLDLAGYTRMCEVLGTERAEATVERFFKGYFDDVRGNRGDIAETAGDGLMILFEHPDPVTNARDAARAALACQRTTARLNAERSEDQEAVVVNIGINSGPASVGVSKIEGAAASRYTYTATGPTTNVASRVQAAATEGAIFITAETAERIEGAFALTDLGERSLKNVAEPTRLFSLDGDRPKELDQAGPGSEE